MSSPAQRVVLRPNQSWLQIDWRGIVQYSDLLVQLVLRDFTAKYKQTLLGPVWSVVNPLLTTLVFTLLFGGVMKVSTNGIPPLLFYLCSLLGWTYFSNVLSATATSLSNNARVFSKVYFPRLIPPLAVTVSNLVGFVIQFLFFCCAYTYYKFFTDYGTQLSLSAWAFLFPVLILQVAMLGLGTGLVITSLTAKYRDLTNLTGLFIQLWMYMTPVIYPLSRIPERWRWVAQINPMTAVVETMRLAFLHSGDVTIAGYGLSFGMTCVILVTGVLCYQRMARTFIDTF